MIRFRRARSELCVAETSRITLVCATLLRHSRWQMQKQHEKLPPAMHGPLAARGRLRYPRAPTFTSRRVRPPPRGRSPAIQMRHASDGWSASRPSLAAGKSAPLPCTPKGRRAPRREGPGAKRTRRSRRLQPGGAAETRSPRLVTCRAYCLQGDVMNHITATVNQPMRMDRRFEKVLHSRIRGAEGGAGRGQHPPSFKCCFEVGPGPAACHQVPWFLSLGFSGVNWGEGAGTPPCPDAGQAERIAVMAARWPCRLDATSRMCTIRPPPPTREGNVAEEGREVAEIHSALILGDDRHEQETSGAFPSSFPPGRRGLCQSEPGLEDLVYDPATLLTDFVTRTSD